MAIDERSRHEMHTKLEALLGPEVAATLVGHLPPVGWADVATRRDLDLLEARLERRFERALRTLTMWLVTTMTGVATIALLIARFA